MFAAGETGISELDIQVIARASLPLPQPGPTLVVEHTTGPEAAITPCWKNMVPIAVPALVIGQSDTRPGPRGGAGVLEMTAKERRASEG